MSRNDFCLSSVKVQPRNSCSAGLDSIQWKPAGSRRSTMSMVEKSPDMFGLICDQFPAGNRRGRSWSWKQSSAAAIDREDPWGRLGAIGRAGGSGFRGLASAAISYCELGEIGGGRSSQRAGHLRVPAGADRGTFRQPFERSAPRRDGRTRRKCATVAAAASPRPARATRIPSPRLSFGTARAMTASHAVVIKRAAVHRVGLPSRPPGASRPAASSRSLGACCQGALPASGRSKT